MTVNFEFEGQPYAAEIDNGRIVMLRSLRREVNGQLVPLLAWENPERIEGALAAARKVAGLEPPPTDATAPEPVGLTTPAVAGRGRSRGQRR